MFCLTSFLHNVSCNLLGFISGSVCFVSYFSDWQVGFANIHHINVDIVLCVYNMLQILGQNQWENFKNCVKNEAKTS